MKNNRKSLALILSFALLICMFASIANASELRYIPCPDGGKHTMQQCKNTAGSTMRGNIYKIESGERIPVVTNGYVYQCTKCYMALITKKQSAPIGLYAIDRSWSYSIDRQVEALDMIGGASGNITSTPDATISGMEFI